MTTRREYIMLSIIMIGFIAAVILITSMFGGSKKPDNNAYKESIQLINKTLDILKAEQQQNVKLHDQIVADKDKAVASADSLLNVILVNQFKYQNLNKNYEKVATNIRNISSDDAAILRAFSDY